MMYPFSDAGTQPENTTHRLHLRRRRLARLRALLPRPSRASPISMVWTVIEKHAAQHFMSPVCCVVRRNSKHPINAAETLCKYVNATLIAVDTCTQAQASERSGWRQTGRRRLGETKDTTRTEICRRVHVTHAPSPSRATATNPPPLAPRIPQTNPQSKYKTTHTPSTATYGPCWAGSQEQP